MTAKPETPGEIYRKLFLVEGMMKAGWTFKAAAEKIGVCADTLMVWQETYGSHFAAQDKKMAALERENLRLKSLVTDQGTDLAILKDISSDMV